MTGIPSEVIQTDGDSEIPQRVAEIPQEGEEPEATPYLISFVNYKDKLCEIPLLDRGKAQKALEALKTIGTKIYSEKDYQRVPFAKRYIANAGDYAKLYSGLPEDTDIFEHKLSQTACVFFYDIESKRTCYIVTITQNHLETDKVRR
jgi:hypothetical protein